MLLGQKVKCVFPEKTLIRIINELQGEKFGVAQQTGITLGRSTSHPLPGRTLLKNQIAVKFGESQYLL